MKIESTNLSEVKIISPTVYEDERGYFFESYKSSVFDRHGLAVNFKQDNEVKSDKGILRGLHYQLSNPQGKLIRVIKGAIIDVAVDIRLGSPTFSDYVMVGLNAENKKMLYIPEGFAHGYLTLVKNTIVVYKCTNIYDVSDEYGVIWNDPTIKIKWNFKDPILSKKDLELPMLSNQNFLPKYRWKEFWLPEVLGLLVQTI